MKHFLWEVEKGVPYTPKSGVQRIRNSLHWRLARLGVVPARTVHNEEGYYNIRFGLQDIPDSYCKMTVVRDPIMRLRSAWIDKVNAAQFAWNGDEIDLLGEGLSRDPTLGEFIDGFETYRAVSRPVRVHVTPYEWHIGPSLDYFDEVLRIEDGATLSDFLSSRLGSPVALERENSRKDDTRDQSLTQAQVDKLLAITAADYALLGGLYDPEAALSRLDRTG